MKLKEIGKVLVCLEDCDGTSIPGNMQEPWLRDEGINLDEFWGVATGLPGKAWEESGVNIDKEKAYLILFARCARGDNEYAERFPQLIGTSNAKLRKAGRLIKPFRGYPDYYFITKDYINTQYGRYGISLEHASVSTGFREMILGSPLNLPGPGNEKGLDHVYASEFLEQDGIIYDIARAVGHQKKTEFLHMVNKGANVWPEINVNDNIPRHQRRVPWFNMIYSGDSGAHRTDHAAFATIRHKESKGGLRGFALAVYDPKLEEGKARAERFYRQEKVDAYTSAETKLGSERLEIILEQLDKRADWIVFNQKLRRSF